MPRRRIPDVLLARWVWGLLTVRRPIEKEARLPAPEFGFGLNRVSPTMTLKQRPSPSRCGYRSGPLATRLLPQTTCEVLAETASKLPLADGDIGEPPVVLADPGCENVNGQVDALLDVSPLQRILARSEIAFSNSMIEAWWRSLKHGWLFLHQLDSVAVLDKLIAFYVQQHNSVMPHAAFQGQTPDEVFAGVGDRVPEVLAEQRRAAREARIQRNRELTCSDCSRARAPPGSSEVASAERNAA